jgi:hypothetical protein
MWQFFVEVVALLHGKEWLFSALGAEALHHHHQRVPYFTPGCGTRLQLERVAHGQYWPGGLAGLFKG